MSITSNPGFAPCGHAARTEERVLDLRRIRNAQDRRPRAAPASAAGSAASTTPSARKRSSASRCRCTLAVTSKPARRNEPRHRLAHCAQVRRTRRAQSRAALWAWPQDNLRDAAKAVAIMTAAVTPAIARPTFDAMNLSIGKRTRLHRLMYEHGPANGTLMMLPIDQGLEHGPVDFFDNPAAIDTDWIYRLAVEGNFSGIALHVGLAEKYQKEYAGRVPLLAQSQRKDEHPVRRRSL